VREGSCEALGQIRERSSQHVSSVGRSSRKDRQMTNAGRLRDVGSCDDCCSFWWG
jgi:hypothetical protein